jgi:toxin HigB-1
VLIVFYEDKLSKSVASGASPKGFPADMLKRALNKLTILDCATSVNDLRSTPGDRLEILGPDRIGQHSIRINGQWPSCFVWPSPGQEHVEIVDCH